MNEKLREKVATDILGFHVGTPSALQGTSLRPQPEWCNDVNCKKYKDACEYCIADQIIPLIRQDERRKVLGQLEDLLEASEKVRGPAITVKIMSVLEALKATVEKEG